MERAYEALAIALKPQAAESSVKEFTTAVNALHTDTHGDSKFFAEQLETAHRDFTKPR